jgi:hypothetical protein
MSGNPVFDYISASAVSLTMAGNTGISPFLTLFLLGVLEMAQPEWINMGPTMEWLLASWWSVGILGLLTVAEMIGKCIPALDEVIDSAEVFVVPIISVLSTLATMGMLPMPSQDDAGMGQKINVGELLNNIGEGGDRYLQDELNTFQDTDTFFSEGFMTFTKVSLVGIGMGLALAIHFFKMVVRVSSLMCSGGCCQPCITIVEDLLVVIGVILAILAPAVAIVASIAFMIAAGYVIRKKCCKTKDDNESKEEKTINDSSNNNDDLENRSTPQAVSAELVEKNDLKPPAEAFAITDGFEDVPLASPMSSKLDVEAKTY